MKQKLDITSNNVVEDAKWRQLWNALISAEHVTTYSLSKVLK